MAKGIDIRVETKEVQTMVVSLLKKLENPRHLVKFVSRYVHAQTMKMFRGRRADNSGVRGVKWPKLKESTVWQKRALKKAGKSIATDRPMVRTAKLRDSLKTIKSSSKGFIYGTKVKSGGFPYPGHHNANKFPWLFLNQHDMATIAKMTKHYIDGKLKSLASYTRGNK